MSDSTWPRLVSVVVPARNAAATLPVAVESALSQRCPWPLEVVVAVGPSEDDTRVVADRLAADDRVRVVDNPDGTTPAALNRAIGASHGEVVVRLDAHAVLPDGYVATAVRALDQTGAGNVGGRQVPTADAGFARAVAAAMGSLLGSGGATYRSGTRPGPVDTVYLGVFRRQALDEVGGFDEHLVRNQDYELNHRLRTAGWEVWFEPTLAVTYRPRGSLRALASQYHDYGRFKRHVVRMHPSSVRARQLAPVLMVGGVVASLGVGAVAGWWWLPALAVAGYVALLLVGGALADLSRTVPVAGALATMHWAWAIGFLRGPGRGFGASSRDTGDSDG